ncbi:hypothetical protein H5410_004203 [Solanum commersonii]|uniref:Uncharacterized protein n=1 Tax=Solanum commersonii TaxID=4109 RepID=A0A9J6B702_SOLCO|nr:hypothetical protein H5410_004203 [Solanum commersonii]
MLQMLVMQGKEKKIEPSEGDDRNGGNNWRRKSSLRLCESITIQPFIEEVSDDDDSLEEESDPNNVIIEEDSDPHVVIIAKEEEEDEESDLDVVITAEVDPILNATNGVVSSTSSMCRRADKSKEVADTMSYCELKFEFSTDVFRRIRRRFLKSPNEKLLPLEKEEWKKEIEDIFVDIEMCILEAHIGFTNKSASSMQS